MRYATSKAVREYLFQKEGDNWKMGAQTSFLYDQVKL
jgi:hypothetical protein